MTSDQAIRRLEKISEIAGGSSLFGDIARIMRKQNRDLAECYRLTGADPNGNEDWRLACHAVEEVRRLRKEYDDAIMRENHHEP